MDTPVVIGIVVIALILIGLVIFALQRRGKSKQLRERFGPEYERTVQETGGRRAAEQDLEARAAHRDRLEIRPLDPVQRDEYVADWRAVQARFVDEPERAVSEAHDLVTSVMRDRGYPVDDFEQRAADISVDHPEVVEDYRVAYRVSLESQEGRASTEDLREAMVRYRSLFAALLDTDDEASRDAGTSDRRA